LQGHFLLRALISFNRATLENISVRLITINFHYQAISVFLRFKLEILKLTSISAAYGD